MATSTTNSSANEPLFEGHSKENSIDRALSVEGTHGETQESQEQVVPVEYPTPFRQVFITIGLMLGMFLVRHLEPHFKLQ